MITKPLWEMSVSSPTLYMKTAFIHRLGAYGDLLHASHLPRLIKEYYKVDKLDFETSIRGIQILQNNPYIDNLSFVEAEGPNAMDRNTLFTRWEDLKDRYDLFFNLINTIEVKYCCNETDQRYYRNDEYRRSKCGEMNFYDAMTFSCNLPETYYGIRGELYYSETEHETAKQRMIKWKEEYNADWLILVALSGSSMHKRFQSAESVCNKILMKYPEALIVLTGDEACLCDEFKHSRIISKINKWNFRTVALMVKYFDFYIGPETGLTCVAHLWDTPTLQLLTAASWDNHIKYAKNAYWVQADCACSPCHKNPVTYYGCTLKNEVPLCVESFSEDKIMTEVEKAYVNRSKNA